MLSILMLLLAPAFASSDSLDARVDALLADRHHDGCAQIFQAGPPAAVRDALATAVDRPGPPWAPLRAVGCLTEQAATDDAAFALVRSLIARPELPGLAVAAAEKVDVLPAARAVVIAEAALRRAEAEPQVARRVSPVLGRSVHAPVRAMVVPVVAPR
jgi:hypothetical protein